MKHDTAPHQRDEQAVEDRAVSPVIGVILMVAITVILAAVIGTFVLDLGQNVGQTGPQASISVSDASADWNHGDNTNETIVQFSHDGGGDLAGDEIRIVLRNASNSVILSEYDAGTITAGPAGNTSPVSFRLNGDKNLTQTDTVSAGDIVGLEINQGQSTAGDADIPSDGDTVTVNVIHKESDNSVGQATVEVN